MAGIILLRLTLAVPGRRPTVSVRFQQNRKRAAVPRTAWFDPYTLLSLLWLSLSLLPTSSVNG